MEGGWITGRLANRDQLLTVKSLYDKFGFANVVGVQLYGRKAIAGPICVVSVILKPTHKINLKTVDKLSERDYRELNEQIRQKAVMLQVGWVSIGSINKLGLHDAISMALNTCLMEITPWNPASLIFIDNFVMSPPPTGVRDSDTPIFVTKKGKEYVEPIMAASIVARVAREAMMVFLHNDYPEYEWKLNGGFATAQHIDLIHKYGISPHHRDLSRLKALTDFKAFPNKRWREEYESSYFDD